MDILKEKIPVLFKNIHASSLAVFRIFFGGMFFYLINNLEPYLVEELSQSKFLFNYDFAEWINLPSKKQMQWMCWGIKLFATLVLIGAFYRISIIGLALLWCYIFLLCKGHYNNHYYLYCLLSIFMCFCHANRLYSIDSWWAKKNNKPLSNFIPFWQVFIFRLQLFIVYFFGGLVKINGDWLSTMPVRVWNRNITEEHDWLRYQLTQSEYGPYFFSLGGILFDLSIGFLLFSPKWRKWALIPLFGFHISNHFMFSIGTFPWTMMAITLLFFPPELPQKLIDNIRFPEKVAQINYSEFGQSVQKKVILIPIAIYFLLQVLIPLRGYILYPAYLSWHGQGHLFSWRMMLNSRAEAVRVHVSVPETGEKGYINLQDYMTGKQLRRIGLAPKNMARLAHLIRDDMRNNSGIIRPDIRIHFWKELNNRPYQLVIDTSINMAFAPYPKFSNPEWLLPMKNFEFRDKIYHLSDKEVMQMDFK